MPSIFGVLGALQSASSLLGGGPLQLGDMSFTGFAVPERISYGGDQSAVVHKMPGGDRVVDALGRDDASVSWSAIFLGPTAADEADQLDQMRADGEAVDLNWGQHSLQVIIQRVELEHGFNRVDYRVSCIVLQPAEEGSSAFGIKDLVGDDIANAIDTVAGGAREVAQVAQRAASVASSLGIGSAALSGVVGKLNLASGAIGGVVSTSGAAINAVAGTNGIIAHISQLPATVAATAQHAGAVLSTGYIGRALHNLFPGGI